eukprot:GEMP01081330.1.p1 GENE.GEMP01081330.1~~GEMP01081330.1.p1  ORF type:complete len:104 (+),score=21.75 GEMP01081330.1:327-638(+)
MAKLRVAKKAGAAKLPGGAKNMAQRILYAMNPKAERKSGEPYSLDYGCIRRGWRNPRSNPPWKPVVVETPCPCRSGIVQEEFPIAEEGKVPEWQADTTYQSFL